ncbi:MAG: tetratricopeptide repeat protein [Candidatus Omnitrophota bacterium]|nr:tetratricopeptide repeat protein [Candidatus Omnitrophota bacterium]
MRLSIERVFFPLLLIAVGIAAYHNSFLGPFVYDDRLGILQDLRGHDLGAAIASLKTGVSRWLVTLTFALNYRLGGTNVGGYHLFNLAVHLSAGCVLFGVVRATLARFYETRLASSLGLAAAMLWLVHPLQTQSVTYISQRAEAMTGLFYLLALYSVIRDDQSKRGFWQLLGVIAGVLGMLSKPVMVTAPVVIALYDRVFLSESWRTVFTKRGWLYFSLVLSCGLLYQSMRYGLGLSSSASPEFLSAGLDLPDYSPLQYALIQPAVILHYLKLSLWPDPLCIHYVWPAAEGLRSAAAPVAAIVILLVLTAVALFRKPWLGFLGAAFFLILSPTSSIVPIRDAAAEHRMYLPLAVVCMLFTLALWWVLQRMVSILRLSAVAHRAVGIGLFGLVIGLLAWGTVGRNRDYRNEVTLWQKAIEVQPHNPRAHNAVGLAMMREGKAVEAMVHLLKAIELKPNYYDPLINMGLSLAALGRKDEAVTYYRRAIELAPHLKPAYNNMGNILAGAGRYDEAKKFYLKAAEIDPEYVQVFNNLGNISLLQGDFAQAVSYYEKARNLDPEYADTYNNLAFLRLQQGSLEEADRLLRKALELDPNHAEAERNLRELSSQINSKAVTGAGHNT